jgi:hypothetical protein
MQTAVARPDEFDGTQLFGYSQPGAVARQNRSAMRPASGGVPRRDPAREQRVAGFPSEVAA